ncbi:MAG: winged helix-turn-helix transcriptional regulator, partial [Geodermatophilaceae bacterium]|nr:winged helix-turn-helix transcriptional regulator [Geodermatophilaceae bacterium]
CFALYAATNAVTRAYRPLLERIGLTYPQYLVMLVLWQDGGRAVHEIASRLSLPPHAVSPMLDRLEAAGFLVRNRRSPDRRVVHVALTDAGAALETAASAAQHDVVCRTELDRGALDGLREQLHDLVDRMEDPTRPARPARNRPRHRAAPPPTSAAVPPIVATTTTQGAGT